MRYTLIIVVFSTLLTISGGVQAEGNYAYSIGFGYSSNGHGSKHGYGGAHGYGHGSKHYSRPGNRYGYRHGNSYKFGHGYKYRHGNRSYRHNPGSRFGYSYRHHGSHYDGGEIAGALLLGGVIGYGLSNTRQRNSYHTNYYNYYRDPYLNSRDIVYPGSRRVTESTASTGRRLYKDRDGNCSEMIRNSFGDELRIQLDRSECNW